MSFAPSRSPALVSRARHTTSNHDNGEERRPKTNFSRTLVIGRGITIKGALQDVEKLVIEGTVETDHLTAKELVIAHGGAFQGIANVETAEISGTLDGELTARNSLCVRNSGRLNGDASCRRLQVDEGGEIIGKLDIITTPQQPNAATPAKQVENDEPNKAEDPAS
ncbi:polymer-forming cytoskeletal protein [Saccharibacter sp. 17.LH.SD]|uniref:bactofilin family protein n=1 Tax=Saccharibacter sp. 17.LH.SD TaxID=2689393 RepID=UPI001371DDFB|nr:polymer-forming cytoskeletal protein [Saccharibacter sp. 17.LH.SD]MXV43804.1 polymer-forming cytoskeletal protein [Saccharibacter sp. 17.LH.SD]